MSTPNPFLAPSTLAYGLPPFEEIRFEHFLPAFDLGFLEHLAEIEKITGQADAPTVSNTLIPLETSGQLLARVSKVFYNRSSADSDDETAALEADLAPRMAAHSDAIRLNAALFARITALKVSPGTDDPETLYLIERHHTAHVRSGAALGSDAQERLRALNGTLSTLTTRFEKNLLADTNDLAVVIDDIADLDGLAADDISATAEAARGRGLDGKWVITLVLPTGHPYLAQLTNPVVRERLMAASRSRGNRGNAWDNRALVVEIAQLRAERAVLLGFASHAAYVTADSTAGSPESVAAMLGRLAPAAARNAHAEQGELQTVAGGAPIAAADWSYYSEKVRAEKFDVDTAAMRPYFEAENVLQNGIFFAATRLYGVTFTERADLVGYHPGVRVFEVKEEDGTGLGLYLLDLYTRDSKRGGAWMNSFLSQSELLGFQPIVTNNLNVPKPAEGEKTLLTYDLVTTFFHEFGHALHGLFAHVTYPRFAGTNVYRDFVEYPSQVNEMWMLWPEVLENFAVHVGTGERIPAALVARLQASSAFNEGFATSEYLAAALLDQAWHTIGTDTEITDVATFEANALASVGLDNPAVPTRYSSTYFAHTFSGGYAAAYYSYIWSEVLDADTVAWFTENGGLTRENGERFRRRLLGVGGSIDPLAAYRDFRGRDAVIEPLLERRGLN